MPFNADKFLSAKLNAREEDVPVPDLKAWFDAKETPVWRVRGLTGAEMARVLEAVSRNKNRAAIAEGLMSDDDRKQIEALRAMLGVGDNVPDDIAKRLEQLVLGSVEPKCDQQLAVRLCESFAIEFYQLTNKITALTGMGYELGKPKHSTKTTKSAPA